MKRIVAWFGLLSVVLLAAVSGAPAANAAGKGHVFDSWDYQIVLNEDGWADVTLTIDADFGRSGAHGPWVVFKNKTGLSDDPDHYWYFDYQNFQVSSPTGAPAKFDKQEEDGSIGLKIGSKSRTVYGKQTYVLRYRVYGLINPKVSASGMDELNLLAIGGFGELDYRKVTLTVTGPADVRDATAFVDKTRVTEKPVISGKTVTYKFSDISYYQNVTVVAGWPAGTFNADPSLIRRPNMNNLFETNPAILACSIFLGIFCIGAAGANLYRNSKDQYYAGLVPGLTPVNGSATVVSKLRNRYPTAVQFSPPKNATPGEIGTLIDEQADLNDITAMIVDLAVRKYITIVHDQNDSWAFSLNADLSSKSLRKELTKSELKFLRKVFTGNELVVTSEDLTKPKYATLFSTLKDQLYSDVTKRGWFKNNPQKARNNTKYAGNATILVSLLGGGYIAYKFGLGWLAVGPLIAAVIFRLSARSTPVRTATGSAVLAQAKGFELFLTTADAQKLRWEEQQNIFSKYLPYAIAFGCADKWAKTFENLARIGAYNEQLDWYQDFANPYQSYSFLMLADSLSRSLHYSMSSSFESAMANAVKVHSSDGGGFSSFFDSGFSGGGGFGGAGGGSW